MVKLSQISQPPSKICSIDASTNSLAFGIFEDGILIEVGKINFKGTDTYKKVSDAVKKTKAFFAHHSDIEAVVIEHTIYLNSAKTVSDLALVQGAILGGVSLNGVKTIKSINPIAWQTFLGNQRLNSQEKEEIQKSFPGKSTAWYKNKEREFRKQRTIQLVNEKYNRSISDDDVADAVGVGHYALHNWQKLG